MERRVPANHGTTFDQEIERMNLKLCLSQLVVAVSWGCWVQNEFPFNSFINVKSMLEITARAAIIPDVPWANLSMVCPQMSNSLAHVVFSINYLHCHQNIYCQLIILITGLLHINEFTPPANPANPNISLWLFKWISAIRFASDLGFFITPRPKYWSSNQISANPIKSYWLLISKSLV